MNVVVTGAGKFIEVQGTAEHAPFDRAELDSLLDLAVGGTAELAKVQQDALRAGALTAPSSRPQTRAASTCAATLSSPTNTLPPGAPS